MKLIQIKIEHFRNFIDSSPIKVEPDITCFVGKNESGKTALLHALYRLLPSRSNVKFSLSEQYPAWLEKKHRQRGDNIEKVRPISTVFELDESDKELIIEEFGINVLSKNQITLSRDYSGTLDYDIPINEKALLDHFIKKTNIPQYLLKEIDKNNNFEELLEKIERIQERSNVKEEVKIDLANLKKEINSLLEQGDLSKAVWNFLKPIVPELFYFHTYSTLPYSVEIKKILKTQESELSDGEITARSLLRLAAADDEYLLNPEYERRKRELENVANSLSQDVLKYWSQNPKLRVNPDITQTTVNNSSGRQSVVDELKIRIWDDRHLLSLPFDEHSTGFQWFFSFLSAFSEFEFNETPVIILLDEPALGLHARAQSDFLKFIEERLAKRNQVIYTTHSPFMIQPTKLDRVRIVEDKGRENGATVSSDIFSSDSDTLFPLQGALGYDMIQHLFINEHNLVVEGTSDFTYLTVISDYLKDKNRINLDEKWSVVPVGGIDMIPTFVSLLGHHLDVTVVIDAQRVGHQKLANLADAGYLSSKKIITVGEIIKSKYADIEDLFSVSDYLNIYNKAFSDNIKPDELLGSDQINLRIARFKKIDKFDHGKPADIFLRKRDEILPDLSGETLDNFEKLFERINQTLSKYEKR